MFKICQLLIVAAVLTMSAFGAETTIIIPAADAKTHSGNFVAQESRWDDLGVFHGVKGYVTWKFTVKNAGKYYVQALYASGEKRPCTFQLTLPNGDKKELKSVFGEAT
ncbi:MAG: hypothetical protein LBF88_08870, partial [Planctomycetaceae bacterium]|nr:hypothetical protein [Planctomycetaceae bacterium]